jgi:hypothetical protein
MESGEQALKRLQDIDKNTGFVDPAQKRKAEAEYKRSQERGVTAPPVAPLISSADGALDDKALAMNMLSQAKRMEVEAKGMIAEAARMKKDAQRMSPSVTLEHFVAPESAAPATTAPKRGRPARAKAVPANAVQ